MWSYIIMFLTCFHQHLNTSLYAAIFLKWIHFSQTVQEFTWAKVLCLLGSWLTLTYFSRSQRSNAAICFWDLQLQIPEGTYYYERWMVALTYNSRSQRSHSEQVFLWGCGSATMFAVLFAFLGKALSLDCFSPPRSISGYLRGYTVLVLNPWAPFCV